MSQSAVGSMGCGEFGAGWEQEPGGGARGDVWLAVWEAVGRVRSRWEMVQREPGSEEQKCGVWPARTSACGHTGWHLHLSYPRARPRRAMSCWDDHAGCPWSLWVGQSTGESRCLHGLVPPVPRLLFEDWTHKDFQSVWDSEDEIEELSRTLLLIAKVRPGTPQAGPCLGGRSCPQAPGLGLGGEGHEWTAHRRALATLPVVSGGTHGPLRGALQYLWREPRAVTFLVGRVATFLLPSCSRPGPFRASISMASWWRCGASC